MISTRTLTLAERKQLYLDHGHGLPAPSTAGLKYTEWHKRTQFGDNSKRWRAWLGLSGVTEDQAKRLIELDRPLTPDEWRSVASRGWGKCLSEALEAFELASPQERAALAPPGLNAVCAPFLAWARRRLQDVLEAREGQAPSISPLVLERMLQWLQHKLGGLAAPSMGMAVNIARVRGELAGETPEARGADFALKLLDPVERVRIVAAFPVLDRLLAQAAASAVEGLQEMLARLTMDHAQLKAVYGIGDSLTDVGLGKGDAHRGGRAVCFLSFDATRLVYKPRSMVTEAAFGALLAWLGPRMGVDLDLLDVLDRGDYAWVNFIDYRECASEAEVETAHRNMGRILAALHLCVGSDLHFENLIFQGDRPVVIDLETLMVSMPRLSRGILHSRAKASHRTLLMLGYLPRGGGDTGPLADVSAAGFDVVRETTSTRLQDVDRDDVRMSPQPVSLKPGQNVPRLNGEVRSPSDAVSVLVDGFREAYQVLLRGRAFLAGPDSPLEAFRSAAPRWVARGTAQYSGLMQAARHPTRTRDGVDYEMTFGALLTGVPGIQGAHSKRILNRLASERSDMLAGDIPYFVAAPDSLDAEGIGGMTVPKALQETPWASLKARLQHLSRLDMERQAHIIELCFQNKRPGIARRDVPERSGAFRETGAGELSGALEIGRRICDRALLVDGLPFWARMAADIGTDRKVALTEDGLYDGAAGIGVFLAELAVLTGQARFRAMALRCLKFVRRAGLEQVRLIGAYSGQAGLLYGDVRISQALGLEPHASWARYLERIRDGAARDRSLDIIGGVAGAAIVAARIADRYEHLRPCALEAATACADRLEETVEYSEGAVFWRCGGAEHALTGLSHGTSGIAWALGELAGPLGRERYFELAQQALAFEDASFDPERRSWRDLRSEEKAQAGVGMAWCHGAPGMALARARLLELGMPDPTGRRCAETEYVLEAEKASFAEPCLCHGSFGNAEILRAMGGRFARAGEAMLASARFESIPSLEARLNFNSPGLMTGMSGVGLAMLRRVDTAIPSVLTLDLRT